MNRPDTPLQRAQDRVRSLQAAIAKQEAQNQTNLTLAQAEVTRLAAQALRRFHRPATRLLHRELRPRLA